MWSDSSWPFVKVHVLACSPLSTLMTSPHPSSLSQSLKCILICFFNIELLTGGRIPVLSSLCPCVKFSSQLECLQHSWRMKGEQGSARAAWGGMHEKPSVLTQGDEEHLTLVVDIYSCIVIQECHSVYYLAMTVGGNTSFSLSLHKHPSDSCCRCLSCDFPSVPALVLIPE